MGWQSSQHWGPQFLLNLCFSPFGIFPVYVFSSKLFGFLTLSQKFQAGGLYMLICPYVTTPATDIYLLHSPHVQYI